MVGVQVCRAWLGKGKGVCHARECGGVLDHDGRPRRLGANLGHDSLEPVTVTRVGARPIASTASCAAKPPSAALDQAL